VIIGINNKSTAYWNNMRVGEFGAIIPGSCLNQASSSYLYFWPYYDSSKDGIYFICGYDTRPTRSYSELSLLPSPCRNKLFGPNV
ncbi:MAG: hypothetical protein ACKOAD_04580, partial [Gammaproteobacteria bacterium]